jgi:hypothetical protein
MSEPMSSVDIEDVLSSIRRLVSEDLRPSARQAKADVAPAAPEASAEKLILTPALRVTPEDEHLAADEAATVEPTFHSIRHMPAQPAASSIESVVTVVSAGIKAHGDDYEAILGDPAPQYDDDLAKAFGGDWPLKDEGSAQGEDDFGPEAPFANVVQFDEGAEDTVITAAFDVEELVAEVAAESAAPAPETLEAPVADLAEVAPAAEAEAVQDQATDFDADHHQAAPDEAASDARDEDAAWADAAEADVIAELAEEIETETLLRMDVTAEFDDRSFDEDMLRDLVRDMIREELQGTLGERITRNVRKLVRAEIARALAVRDFD